MSAPNSRKSPSPGSPSEDNASSSEAVGENITAFDSAEALLRAWGRSLTPDPWLTVSEWSDTHRWLSSRASAAPGLRRRLGHCLPVRLLLRILRDPEGAVGAHGLDRSDPASPIPVAIQDHRAPRLRAEHTVERP